MYAMIFLGAIVFGLVHFLLSKYGKLDSSLALGIAFGLALLAMNIAPTLLAGVGRSWLR